MGSHPTVDRELWVNILLCYSNRRGVFYSFSACIAVDRKLKLYLDQADKTDWNPNGSQHILLLSLSVAIIEYFWRAVGEKDTQRILNTVREKYKSTYLITRMK